MINRSISKLTSLDRTNLISDYVNHNLLAFQYLRNKNYKTAMTTFEKCIDIAKDIDEMKHVESLTNLGICQYFCGKFGDSFSSLDRAREISTRLLAENSDRQIQL
jgi:Tfp pilus assembly protein PilF